MKKSILFVILLLVAAINVHAYDFSAVCSTGQTLYYNINSDGTSVTVTNQNISNPYYSSYPTGNLEIPSSVEYNSVTYLVTEIGDYAFSSCVGLHNVVIPNTVTTIGQSAFHYCNNIDSLYIGSGVTTIGDYAFFHCLSLHSLVIPNSVTTIGQSAFQDCLDIDSLYIGSGVTYIGAEAFRGCTGLKYLFYNISSPGRILPDLHGGGDTNILFYFMDINHITSPFKSTQTPLFTTLVIGDSVKTLAYNAFADRNTIRTIIIHRSNPPAIKTGTFEFDQLDSIVTVIVPCGTVETYRNADNWNRFNNIQENNNTPFSLSVNTNNLSMGSVEITHSPTCHDNTAIFVAHPLPGYSFRQWSDSIADNPRSITLTQDTSLVAIFVLEPCDIVVTSDNTTMGTACCSGTYNYGQSLSITATPNYSYHFTQWNDGNTDNPRTIAILGNSSFTAYFAINTYNIVASANNNTMGVVSGSGTYTHGQEVTIFASPNYGYHFVRWDDGMTDNPRTITATSDGTFTAIFEPNDYVVTVESFNTMMGTACCSGTYSYGQSLSITATPSFGYHFSQWNDGHTQNPRTLTVEMDCSFTAYFALNTYNVVAEANNNTMGNVSGSGAYLHNQQVTIEAIPAHGHHFVQWNDGITDNPRTVIITSDSIFLAQFTPNTYTLTAASNNPTMGNVSGGGTYTFGSQATLSVTAAYRHYFICWNDYNTENPRHVVVTSDTTFTAMFAESPQYNITVTANDTTYGTTTGSGIYYLNDVIPITAEANEQYYFVGWSDGVTSNPRMLTVLSDSNIIAIFAPREQFEVTVTANEPSWGIVSGGGMYYAGDTAIIAAVASEHYYFVGWSDGVSTNPRMVTVLAPTHYVALFEKMSYSVYVTANDYSMGLVTGSGTYLYGSEVTVEAIAYSGYHFVSWSDGVMDDRRTETVTENVTYIAMFKSNDGIEEAQADDYRIYVSNRRVIVEGIDKERLQLYDITGRQHNLYEQLPRGVYVVYIDKTTAKKVVVW